jgi:hypothetical protein
MKSDVQVHLYQPNYEPSAPFTEYERDLAVGHYGLNTVNEKDKLLDDREKEKKIRTGELI